MDYLESEREKIEKRREKEINQEIIDTFCDYNEQNALYEVNYYHDREAVINPLYSTIVKLAIHIQRKKYALLRKQFMNKDTDVWKEREMFSDVDLDWKGIFISPDNKIKNETKTYVKLLLTYDKYNKLHILKNKTKLNNDIIFNIIIKYML